jgi:uncharacterized membrane protein
MKMSRFISGLLLSALILGLTLLFEPGAAQAAKRISLENASGYPINVALVVQTYNGWRVHGWYTVAPYSYRHVTFNDAGGNTFGYYANIRGAGQIQWAGKGNEPTITVVTNAMNHDVRQQPYGSNQRRVKVRMKQGNSVKFTYTPPQQQQQQFRQTGGWW